MDHPDDPFAWVCIRHDRDTRQVNDASLVLTAVGIDNFVERIPAQDAREAAEWGVFIRRGNAELAADHLERYRVENLPPRIRVPPIITVDSGWAGVLGFLCILWALPALEAWGWFGIDWRGAGRMEAALVRDGEWWRTITALTLHGDLAHILGNSLFGAVFGVMAGRYLGSGLCWLLVLLAGAFGNEINALLRPDGFASLGASTATFACVGLTSAFVWRRGYFRGRGWRRGLAPIAAGLALLAFTGMGGANTDILAHVAGFACGVAAGAGVAPFDIRRLGRSGQYLAGGAAVALVVAAWAIAAP